jgi:hypothetical protein
LSVKRFLHWAVLFLLLFAFQEATFRAIFPLPEVENFNRINYVGAPPQTKTASFLGQRTPAMHATFRWNSKPDRASFESHLNLYGFRDADWCIRPDRDKERVMFVGDSLVEGFMAGDQETISRGYDHSAIEGRRPVEAMNFGIGGTGLENYLELMRDAAPLFRPKRIVVVLYANDFPHALPSSREIRAPFTPVFTRAFLPRIFLIANRLRRHQTVPRRWHSRATLFVPVVPDPLSPWTQPPPEYSQVDPSLAEAMRKGDFNPFVVDLLNQTQKALQQPIDPGAILQQFQQIAQGAQAELRVVYLPFATQVSDYYLPFQEKYALQKEARSFLGPEYQIHGQALARSCQELGIPFLDLTPLLRKAESGEEHLYWNYDEHMRGSTYLRVGATIERWVHSTDKVESLALLK